MLLIPRKTQTNQSPFLIKFSTLSDTNFISRASFMLSSASSFNLDKSCILFLTNTLPLNHDFQRLSERTLLKTLWEKEKMLVTSIFSFFHNVFYSIREKMHHLSSFKNCRLRMLSIWTGL